MAKINSGLKLVNIMMSEYGTGRDKIDSLMLFERKDNGSLKDVKAEKVIEMLEQAHEDMPELIPALTVEKAKAIHLTGKYDPPPPFMDYADSEPEFEDGEAVADVKEAPVVKKKVGKSGKAISTE